MTDLAAGLAALDEALPRVTEAQELYDGTAPEIFSSHRMAILLKNSGRKFRLNWCRSVVTAVLNRLEIASISAVTGGEEDDPLDGQSSPAQATLDLAWTRNRMGLLTRDMHEAALSQGETFGIVWPGADGFPRIHHNPPSQVAVVYDPEDEQVKLFGIKRWASGKRTRANLYYADRIERYISDGVEVEGEEGWAAYYDEAAGETEDDWAVPNDYGVVPVFHFRPQWPKARPEHADAYGAQNGLNKLLASYFGTVDYQVAPQRYALTDKSNAATAADEDFQDIEADGETVKTRDRDQPHAGPGTVWWMDNAKAVGQFAPADPETFWKPITQLVQHTAVTTDTPSHVFQFGGTPPSGESRRAENEPLYAKVANRQLGLGPTWEELYTFVLQVAGVGGTVAVDWAPIDRADDKDGLEAAEKKITLGVPRDVVLGEVGYTDREMASWMPAAPTMDPSGDTPPDSPPEGDTP
jgi:hypothetical protein